MAKLAPIATNLTASVKLIEVTKTFTQWQRTGKIKDIAKNLLHPEKKQIVALDKLSLEIAKGEFVAYAGANGAGKSTTIKLLCGMLVPDAGTIDIMGMSPVRSRIELMRRVGILFGNRSELWGDHPVLSSFEWKRVVWDIDKVTYDHMFSQLVDLLDLGPLLHTFSRELSLGQRMRCDLAMTLLHNPSLVLLDEPTLGLDVLAKRRMIEFLRHLNQTQGTTIVVTSHDMDDLEEMANRIVLLSQGKSIFDGDFKSFRAFIGCTKQVRITTKSVVPPKVSVASHLGSLENQHTYLADDDASIASLLTALSLVEGIDDVEFISTPLEQAVASLYQDLA